MKRFEHREMHEAILYAASETQPYCVNVFTYQNNDSKPLILAYITYNGDGACKHEVMAVHGRAAKRAAIEEHREQCLPVAVWVSPHPDGHRSLMSGAPNLPCDCCPEMLPVPPERRVKGPVRSRPQGPSCIGQRRSERSARAGGRAVDHPIAPLEAGLDGTAQDVGAGEVEDLADTRDPGGQLVRQVELPELTPALHGSPAWERAGPPAVGRGSTARLDGANPPQASGAVSVGYGDFAYPDVQPTDIGCEERIARSHLEISRINEEA